MRESQSSAYPDPMSISRSAVQNAAALHPRGVAGGRALPVRAAVGPTTGEQPHARRDEERRRHDDADQRSVPRWKHDDQRHQQVGDDRSAEHDPRPRRTAPLPGVQPLRRSSATEDSTRRADLPPRGRAGRKSQEGRAAGLARPPARVVRRTIEPDGGSGAGRSLRRARVLHHPVGPEAGEAFEVAVADRVAIGLDAKTTNDDQRRPPSVYTFGRPRGSGSRCRGASRGALSARAALREFSTRDRHSQRGRLDTSREAAHEQRQERDQHQHGTT